MNKLSWKSPIVPFLAISVIWSFSANLAHPITPKLILDLELPNYMFGVAFAGMSGTNFLFSPMWSYLDKRWDRRVILLLSGVGYAFGQFLFSNAQTSLDILLARLIAGFFVGGTSICALTYILSISNPTNQASHLTFYSTLTIAGGAAGFLCGGVLGDQSIRAPFLLQVAMLASCGILYRIFLVDTRVKLLEPKEMNAHLSKSSWNKLFSFALIILFGVILFSELAAITFDQCFNFYVRAQFAFKPSYNGMMKAAVGILTLLVSLTASVWLIRQKKRNTYLFSILALCGSLLLSLLWIRSVAGFIGVYLSIHVLRAVSTPLLQNSCANLGGEANRSETMGAYNAIRSLSMVGGGLAAGFLYEIHAKLPFAVAGVLFLIGAGLMFLFRYVGREQKHTACH